MSFDRLSRNRQRVAASVLLLSAVTAGAALGGEPVSRNVVGRSRVELCHYQPDEGVWKKVSVGGNAAPMHLQNHDDALPGGITSDTGTQLSDDCVPVAGDCGDCLVQHSGTGCENAACEAVVCAADSFCCEVDWDTICAGEAQDLCTNVCE